MKKIAVLGSGTMGIDIAILASCHGFDVSLWHRHDSQIALRRLQDRLAKYVTKEILAERDRIQSLERIFCTERLEKLADSDLVIESISENLEEKSALLRRVSNVVSETCILTSNTSSLSIDDLSTSVEGASRFAGFHFFNPVLRMELTEIVAGTKTSSATLVALREIAKKLGKTTVEVKDSSGFIVNRLMASQIREAMLLLEEGVASTEDIDTAVKLGLAHPIGPLALADLIGLDVMAAIFKALSSGVGARFAAPECLKDKVAKGMLGRKTRCGFFDY